MKAFSFLFLLFLLPLVYANFQVDASEPITFFVAITNGTQAVNPSSVDINITFLNGTPVVASSMTQNETGGYLYTTTLNTSGDYKATVRATSGGTYSKTYYFQVRQSAMTSVAIILGLFGLIAYFLYLAKDILAKPQIGDGTHKELTKWLNPKNVGVSLFLITSWLIVALTAVLSVLGSGSGYETILDTIFYATLLLIGAFNVLYFVMYMLFATKQSVESINKLRR